MDQIAEILRASPKALATFAVSVECPPLYLTVPCMSEKHGPGPRQTYFLMEECHGDHHCIVRRPSARETYDLLIKMMNRGDVERLKFSGAKSVYWRWIGADPVDVSELERLYEGKGRPQ